MCPSRVPRPTSARMVTPLMPLLALLALTVGLGRTGSAAGAAPLAGVASATAPQGGTITLTGNISVSDACPGGAPVQLTATPPTGLFPNGVGPQAPRDANGNFRATVVIPATATVGSYTIGISCGGVNASITEVLNVTAGAHVKAAITLSPASAAPGAVVTISGVIPTAGTVICPAGDATQLASSAALFPPNGAGPQVPRDTGGNFHVTYTIPAATAPGKYSVGVRCGGGNLVVVAPLQVTAVAAPTTTTSAPAATTTTAPPTATTATPSTTLIPTTIAPFASTTTTAPAVRAKSSHAKSPLRWVALGVLALLVLAVVAVLARRGGTGP